MRLVLEFRRTAANKMPVYINFDNQSVEIYRRVRTVRLWALCVLFYIVLSCPGKTNPWPTLSFVSFIKEQIINKEFS